jgi:hypothetical protein
VSPVWGLALALLALLVLALAAVVTRLLGVVAATDRTVAGLRHEVSRLQRSLPGPAAGAASSHTRAASALVQLDPACPTCHQLATDLRASGTPSAPGVAVRLLVEDTASGHLLADGLGAQPVPSVGSPMGTPHVLVVGSDGQMLAKGDPATAEELGRMLDGIA